MTAKAPDFRRRDVTFNLTGASCNLKAPGFSREEVHLSPRRSILYDAADRSRVTIPPAEAGGFPKQTILAHDLGRW